MKKTGYLLKALRKDEMNAVFSEITGDAICQQLADEFSEVVIDKLPRKNCLEAERIWNELSTRWMELAYLRGIKDAIQFLIDLREKPLADVYNACRDDADTVVKDRVILHLPKFKWQEQLIAIYDKPFREELFSRLREGGYDSWYIQSVMSTYKGREFGEDIMIIYGDAGKIAEIFKETVRNNHDELGQESYSYEVDNTLYFF